MGCIIVVDQFIYFLCCALIHVYLFFFVTAVGGIVVDIHQPVWCEFRVDGGCDNVLSRLPLHLVVISHAPCEILRTTLIKVGSFFALFGQHR